MSELPYHHEHVATVIAVENELQADMAHAKKASADGGTGAKDTSHAVPELPSPAA